MFCYFCVSTCFRAIIKARTLLVPSDTTPKNMQVSNPNNIKIYNLSAGKSLPEWLSDRRKRTLQKQDVEVRRRIELIQDFEMPTVSSCVKVSKDKQYIYTTGVYKPRVRCYDLSQLSMKFERCFDCETVRILDLSEDYTKLVFLQSDRYLEFHAQHGKYYKTRIPKYGRDLDFHSPSADIYIVGATSEIYRLNLEQGRFLNSLKTKGAECYCCQFNPVHQLFACGTSEGHVECWDPRTRNRVGVLDIALGKLLEDYDLDGVPAVTSLKFKDALNMAVGTSTGQILLYDIRSDKPLLVKDHQYGLPIKDIEYHHSQDLIMSMDKRILKIWNEHTGKAFTSIEPGTDLNDLCMFPDSGMLFLANEAPKVLTYYIPALGPAPRWCSFLDNLTEELEESSAPSVYDDYKFVTRTELEGLGLAHLVGSSLLRAYMHGYFMDMRLYNKAKTMAEPFAFEEYRRKKIREKIEESRKNRVQLKKLPQVNRDLAEKLMDQEQAASKKTKKQAANLLEDDRFNKIFKDPNFQIDPESIEYRLLNPVVSKLDKEKKKREKAMEANFTEVQDEGPDDEDKESDDDSSDDEHTWTQEVKEQHKLIKQEQWAKRREEAKTRALKPKFYEVKEGTTDLAGLKTDSERKKKEKLQKRALGERLEIDDQESGVISKKRNAAGGLEMTFSLKKKESEKESHWRKEATRHHAERRKIRRSAADITKHKKTDPRLFRGKR